MAYLIVSRRSLLFAMPAMALAAAVRPAKAISVAPPLRLTPQDVADIERIEAYLNSLGALRARFQQIGEGGQTADGTLYLQRPGRMRLEYDPPVPILIVANNGLLFQYDKDLKTSSYLPLSSTPAGLLLKEKLQFTGEITVRRFERTQGALRVTLFQTNEPAAGEITLTFSERPFGLVNWQIVDAQGATTRVAFTQLATDVKLDPALFRFAAESSPRQ